MKRWNLLEKTTSPDGQELALYEHDGDYVLRVGVIELMSTRRHHSEDLLGARAAAPAAARRGGRVLIGGLGFSFTLKAVLAALPSDARVLVAELLPDIVAWNRNPAYGLGAEALVDPRVEVRVVDVQRVLMESRGGFDGIALDVDNGAEALTDSGNDTLYRETGIELAKAALRPGGRLIYWASKADPGFEKLLGRMGLVVEVEKARAHATSGGLHVLYICRKR